MPDDLKSRVLQRLTELDLTPEGASKKAGLSRAFLRKMMERQNGNPRSGSLIRLASALETTPAWLLEGTGPKTNEAQPASQPANDIRPADVTTPYRDEMPANIPVMGTAAASIAGAFQFEGGVIDYVRRPPALLVARDIYAIYVEGSSMEPEHRPGDLRFVHPNKPARVGDSVVVQTRNHESDDIQAMIGHLVKRSGDTIVIGKLNPFAEVAISRATVVRLHKVLDMNELFGV